MTTPAVPPAPASPPDRPDDDGSLWSFALAFYGRDGQAETLLELQDRYGRDVLLILCAFWLAATGRQFTSTADAETLAECQHDFAVATVIPVRDQRRAAKTIITDGTDDGEQPLAEALYAKLKAAELAAERLGLARLERHAIRITRPAAPDDRPGPSPLSLMEALLGPPVDFDEAALRRALTS